MDPARQKLDLFLAADDGRPALGEGLPEDAAKRTRKPKEGAKDSYDRRLPDESPNDLSKQGWAIIAPNDKEGDQMLEALSPLRELRESEQGQKVVVHRVPPNMDDEAARAWRADVFWPEGKPIEEVPLYVLLLGDLHRTSAELQHKLATDTLVGRVHFSRDDGKADLASYAAYAEKVVRLAEQGTPEEKGDLLFYTAPDGSAATVTGKLRLVDPSLDASKADLESGRLSAASVRELAAESVDELMETWTDRPGVLLTVSHGLGAPRQGWKTEEDQWRRQGAMILGSSEILDAERAAGQAFLPGGMWFFLACFGAGTPHRSAYHSWLHDLSKEGAYSGSLATVMKSLPADGERPFIARLPQAVLASPRGPLAVIGHLDLAWTYGFSGGKKLTESKKSRILDPLKTLVKGSRVGVALGQLMEHYCQTNDDLMTDYQREKDARVAGKPSPVDAVEQAHRWMLRNDLRGYVLLGDPAARLPLKQNALKPAKAREAAVPQVASRSPEASEPQAQKPQGEAEQPRQTQTQKSEAAGWVPADPPAGPLSPEAAVLAVIRGDESMRVIAQRAGVSVELLWGWVDEYRAAGRARLPKPH